MARELQCRFVVYVDVLVNWVVTHSNSRLPKQVFSFTSKEYIDPNGEDKETDRQEYGCDEVRLALTGV